MADRVPARRDDGVAALPGEPLIADRGFALAFHDVEDGVGGGAIAPGLLTGLQPLHRQPHRRHGRRFERDARTVEAFVVRPRGVELSRDVGAPEAERRGLHHALDRRVLLRMLLEEHRLEQMGERHVEPVEPIGRLVAVMAVAVPAPAGRQHHVAALHRRLLAVDHRVRALAVDDDAERVRRMPVRRRVLAGQNHLVGADQRAGCLEVGARRRIAHHQVAPLRERHIDQAPGGVEAAPWRPRRSIARARIRTAARSTGSASCAAPSRA